MKKTIIALMALAGVASAANEESLVWSLDLTGGSYDIDCGTDFSPATGWGSQDFTTTPGALTSNGDNKIALETPNGGYLDFGMGNSFTLIMNCQLTSVGDLTIVNDKGELIRDTSDTKYWLMSANQNQASWFLGVQYDTTSKQITFGNSDHTLSDLVSYGTYELTDIRTVALVMNGETDKDGEMAIYVNGKMAASGTMAAGDRHGNSQWKNGVVFMNKMTGHDGFAGSMTGAELYNTALYSTKPIPEPATATLSLLALAGLAARRRRK